MPGIVGCITRQSPKVAFTKIRRMTNALLHEQFYVAGTWAEQTQGIYLGWVAHKSSPCSAMPLWNERRDKVVVFSGEDFPDPSTLSHLRQQGHEFDSDGMSYLTHLWEEASSFPAGLNGRFHGMAVDLSRGEATLFNDRYGMHRLYYHESEDAVYFAAEAKAILAVCPELRRVDYQGLGEYVSCGAVLENRSVFQGIQLLPPGAAWKFRNGALTDKASYFNPKEWEEQETLEPEAYYEKLWSVFNNNFPRYFAGTECIGMSLTGGLDTRMVLASWDAAPGTLPCYTFGSMYHENEDVRVAHRVAEVYGQPFHVLTAGNEFLSRFADYAERTIYIGDGSVDVSRSPDLYLNERAREISSVRMTGLYGGELLRGFRAFKPGVRDGEVFSSDFSAQIQRTSETYASVVNCHPISFAAFRQGPWYLYGSLGLEQTQLCMRTPFLDNEFVRTIFRAPTATFEGNDICLRLIADGNRRLAEIPTDRAVGGNLGRIQRTVAHGLLEFLFKAEYAYDIGMPQWLARLDYLFKPLHLEHLFMGRHKTFHFRTWYRNALAGYVRDMLLDERTLSRPYVERKNLESAVEGHLKGNRNYTTEIHKMLTLELIHRLFVDNSGSDTKDESLYAFDEEVVRGA